MLHVALYQSSASPSLGCSTPQVNLVDTILDIKSITLLLLKREIQEDMKTRRQAYVAVNEKMNGVVGLTTAILSFELLRNPTSLSSRTLITQIADLLEQVSFSSSVL